MPDVAQGLQPYVAYHGGGLDQVSLSNGGLTVRIPLVSYPQKGGLALSYSVIFNSFAYQDLETCDSPPDPSGPTGTIPLRTCTGVVEPIATGIFGNLTQTPRLIADQQLWAGGVLQQQSGASSPIPTQGRFYVIGADNSQHPLGVTVDGYRSVDEDGYYFLPSSAPAFGTNLGQSGDVVHGGAPYVMGDAPGTITDLHGVVYTTGSIKDRDNNAITFGTSTTGGGVAFGIPATDSVNRVIGDMVPFSDLTQCPQIPNTQLQPVSSAMQWTVPGPGGTVSYLFCYASVNIRSHIFIGPPGTHTQLSLPSRMMLQSIKLPNGTFWGFIYNADNPSWPATFTDPTQWDKGLGQLVTLIYPTGGSVNYSYSVSSGNCGGQRSSALAPFGVTANPLIPGVATRTQIDASGATLGTWTYGVGQVLSPDGSLTVENFVVDPGTSGCSTGFDAGQTVYAGSTATGTPLRSTTKTYNFLNVPGVPYASSPREIQSTTVLDDGVTSSSVVKTYGTPVINFSTISCDASGLNCVANGAGNTLPIGGPVSETTIGYSGSAMKELDTAYQWQSNPSYFSANLLDLPSAHTEKDGSGNTIEITNYSYDESTYSSARGGLSGHLTTVAKSLNMASGPAPTTHTGYNADGEKASTIDANGNTTSYGYSTTGGSTGIGGCNGSLVTSTTNALGQTISGSYDCPTGLLTSLTDLNGNITSVTWDSMHRITQVTYPAIAAGTPTTSFSYADSTNTVTKSVAASPDPNQTTTVIFDGFGREKTRYTSDGSSSGQAEVDTGYDADGRVNSVSNPYHSGDTVYSTTTTYDALSRLLVVTKPDNNTTTTSYTGAMTDSLDENGTHLQHTTDALGRLVKVMELGTTADPRSLETDYSYDALDSLTFVNQHGNAAVGESPRTRSFTYDSLARLITSQNPETGTICYGTWSGGSCVNGYDANGNLLAKTDANNILMSYTYDALNRLTLKQSNGSSPIHASYQYDHKSPTAPNLVGRLVATLTTFPSGVFDSEVYFYDAVGHINQVRNIPPSTPVAQVSLLSNFDLAGNVISLTYPDGRGVNQVYDAAGRLTSATDAGTGTPYFSSASYTAAGALASASYGNGVSESILYNARLQPCHAFANSPALPPPVFAGGSGSGGNVFDRTSSYANSPSNASTCNLEPGDNGNIAYIADNVNVGWTQSFSYDGLNRLLTASRSDGAYNHTYNYDSFGNLMIQDNINPGPSYNINPSTNQLNRLNGSINEYTYDAAGNLISSGTSDIGGHGYTYNALNQITAVDSGSTAIYYYNGQDERVFKQTASGWTDYVHYGGQPMAEHTSDGTWTDYIFAAGQRIAKITNAGNLNYYMDDHLGTTQVELDAVGNVTWSGQFTPFGAELPDGTTAMHYKFTGKERDAESGLDFFGARYYGSAMGRWLSPDWAEKPEAVPYSSLSDPQSLNLYNYVGNNPLNKDDPNGHVINCDACNRFVARVAGAIGGAAKAVWNKISYPGILNDKTLSPEQRDAAVNQALADHDAAGLELANDSIQLIGVIAESEAPVAIEPGDFHAPGDVPNGQVVVRGGQSDIPTSGTYSGSQGATIEEAGQGVPHGTISPTTAGQIRDAGGTVRPAPEPSYPGGPINGQHVNIEGGQSAFGPQQPNPAPKPTRIPSKPPDQ